MEIIKIENLNLITKLDKMAESLYGAMAKYKETPLPNVSLARARALMKDPEYVKDQDNSIDYNMRFFSDQYKRRYYALLGAMKNATNSENWYYDEVLVQPATWGWSAWNNNRLKSKRFIRFIHNSGDGYTHFIEDGKWNYIPDKHTTENKDWTCIAGVMDGEQWLADRNRSSKPRVVIELAINNKNIPEWEQAKRIVANEPI